jgi:hypothetical protein
MLLTAAALASCAAYVPGAKAYWDAKVNELCEKDGGVTVYERVKITRKEANTLWGTPLPTAGTRRDQPYFWEASETVIRDSNPRVVRRETLLKRRSNERILGKAIQYSRSGGDPQTGISEPTSFVCPQHAALSEQVFYFDEGIR